MAPSSWRQSQVAPDIPVRVYALAAGTAIAAAARRRAPSCRRLRAAGRGQGVPAPQAARPRLAAVVGDERAEQHLRVGATTTPPERSIVLASDAVAVAPEATPVSPPGPRDEPRPAAARLSSPWELGAALSGRYDGRFAGGGLTLQGRRRLGRLGRVGYFALGADLDGHFSRRHHRQRQRPRRRRDACSSVARRASSSRRASISSSASAPAATGRACAARRRRAARRDRQRRRPGAVGRRRARSSSSAASAAWSQLAVGYVWTPLVGAAQVNIDGGALTVGYRAARWRRPRRGGGRRRAGRRRRARGR